MEFKQLNAKQKVYLCIGIAGVIIAGIWYVMTNSNPSEGELLILNTDVPTAQAAETTYIEANGETNTEPPIIVSETPVLTESPEIKEIQVHIVGAVINPGVYKLTEGARVNDAVEAAGGFAEDAAQDSINMAAFIKDAQQITIYRIGEEPEKTEEPVYTEEPPHNAEETKSPEDTTEQTPEPGIMEGKININTATATQLETLPGIGTVIAGNIINYREANGPFTSIEQLKNVQRIGDKVYDRLKDMITVGELEK